MLRPVGRKCPQGTPTLRVTVTVFIRHRQAAFSPFAAGGGFPHGRGSPAPLCAKTRYPAASGKASLPLPKNSTYYKGFTSGYAALVNVPFFVAPPLPPQRVFLRAALRAAGFSAALRFASGVCVPHPAAPKKRRGAKLRFFSNHSPRPRHHWQGSARLSLGVGCWALFPFSLATVFNFLFG